MVLEKFFHHEDEIPDYLDAIIPYNENLFILRLKGKITMQTLPENSDRMADLIKKEGLDKRNMLVDFGKVEDVDSSLVAVLLLRLGEFKEQGNRMGFINLPHELQSLVEIQKADISIFDSEEAALNELGTK